MISTVLSVNLERVKDPMFFKPEYKQRAIETEAKIFKAMVENRKYYKSLQAQEDKKWADIKAKRNKKRGK